MLLKYCVLPKSINEIKKHLGINSRSYLCKKIISPLVKENKLEYTNKKHANASNQKYRTVKGNKKWNI